MLLNSLKEKILIYERSVINIESKQVENLTNLDKIIYSGFSDIEIIYRFLKKYWGVWNPGRSLTFNIELIKTPIQCVDYVIVHELCHLVYPKHDESFYWLLGRILPDWVERKEKLEIFGAK